LAGDHHDCLFSRGEERVASGKSGFFPEKILEKQLNMYFCSLVIRKPDTVGERLTGLDWVP
jgi:hypothetical protein